MAGNEAMRSGQKVRRDRPHYGTSQSGIPSRVRGTLGDGCGFGNRVRCAKQLVEGASVMVLPSHMAEVGVWRRSARFGRALRYERPSLGGTITPRLTHVSAFAAQGTYMLFRCLLGKKQMQMPDPDRYPRPCLLAMACA